MPGAHLPAARPCLNIPFAPRSWVPLLSARYLSRRSFASRRMYNRSSRSFSLSLQEWVACTQTVLRYQNSRTACSSGARSRTSDKPRSRKIPPVIRSRSHRSAPATPFLPFLEFADLSVQAADHVAVRWFVRVFLVFRNPDNRAVCIFCPTDPRHTSLFRGIRARKRT